MTVGKVRTPAKTEDQSGGLKNWGQLRELRFIRWIGTEGSGTYEKRMRFKMLSDQEKSLRRVVILGGYLHALPNRDKWYPGKVRVHELESAALSAIQEEAERWEIDVTKMNGRESLKAYKT